MRVLCGYFDPNTRICGSTRIYAGMLGTLQTFLKLVSKGRAIINHPRMEQGSQGFMDFLANVEDQMHLSHSRSCGPSYCAWGKPPFLTPGQG